MKFELKDYQKDALRKLEQFLLLARTGPIEAAFEETVASQNIKPKPYRKYGFEDVPYVCLRLPTGGGKTVLASHAVKVATKSFIEVDFPIVLWLVPSIPIRTQTLEALKKPDHPYRIELDRYFDRKVDVMDIDDVTGICQQDVGAKTIVVVSTIANLRVTDTSGREVYAHKEIFESHFKTVDPNRQGLARVTKEDLRENGLTEADIGKIKFSFANILALHKPLVIIDEAHNARTPLTFETLQRIHPRCIIELTATPDTRITSGSNILYSVSASELKAQDMIKLPIMLTEHKDGWQSCVRDAVLTRNRLAIDAQKETEYIRPIVLFQAEPKNGEVTVEVLKEFLMTELKISPESIAIATGQQRELDNVNLFSPACPIEHIITIEALKEGWDCSFAYVFCSVKRVKSSTDVEQLLGRVLRMPFAKRRTVDALNRAYAHLASKSFADAAGKLADQLVAMGFEEMEIAANVQSGASDQGDLFGDNQISFKPPVEPPLEIELSEAPDLSALQPEHRKNIEVRESEGGYRVIMRGAVDESVENAILAKVDNEKRKEHKTRIAQHNNRIEAFRAPSLRGERFMPLPQLCYLEQGRLNLLEPVSYRYIGGEWSLLDYPVELPGFALSEKDITFEVDMEGKKVRYHVAEETATYNLNTVSTSLTENDLVVILSDVVTDQYTLPSELKTYLLKLIHHLIKERGLTLTSLLRAKYPLARAIRSKISEIQKNASDKGFQQLLFGNANSLEASFDYEYRFEPGLYPARPPFYQGRYKFKKHYYPIIEDIKETKETDSEFVCAQAIDRHQRVKHWIRNLSQRDHASFRMPLANRWFYPDFVVELMDGRRLVVEYKGEGYKTTDDSREKKMIGESWAKTSGSKCLFLFAVEKDEYGRDVYGQLEAVIGK